MDNNILEWFKKRRIIFDEITNNNELNENDNINESVIDYPQKERSRQIWVKDEKTGKDKLKPELRKKIIEIYDEVLKELDIDKSKLKTIYLFGSAAGFNYHKYTDLDVQAVIDISSEDKIRDLNNLMREKFSGGYLHAEDLEITHPINLYFRKYSEDEDLYPISIDGIYDVLKDEWISETQCKFEIDNNVFEIARNWAVKIDIDVGELKRDLMEHSFYLFILEEEKDNLIKINKYDIRTLLKMKVKEIILDLESLSSNFFLLKQWRNESQTNMALKELTKEEKNKIEKTKLIKINYQNVYIFAGTIVWKLIDRFGYINELIKALSYYAKFRDGKIKENELISKLKEHFFENKELWKH